MRMLMLTAKAGHGRCWCPLLVVRGCCCPVRDGLGKVTTAFPAGNGGAGDTQCELRNAPVQGCVLDSEAQDLAVGDNDHAVIQ